MPRRSPARGPGRTSRKKAPAAVAPGQPQAAAVASPATPADQQRQLEERLRQAVAEIQQQLDAAFAEEHAEYLAATGRPMPVGIDEIHARAVAIGQGKGLPRSSETIGKYTLADVFEMEEMRLRDQEELADKIAGRLSAARPGNRQRIDRRRGNSGTKEKPLTHEEKSLLDEYKRRPRGESRKQFIARQPAVALMKTEDARLKAAVELNTRLDTLDARKRKQKSRRLHPRA
jgi:hypothetical protein